MTENHLGNEFGSLQVVWSDRKTFRKGVWVNAAGVFRIFMCYLIKL
ncbi:hypothetical protein J2Y03_000449 [Neobacillus niacini]|nr:hypothetical protein [Neobacillus niacini]MDR7075461.1 hypothetical protein [Neobacillus niacini]